MAKYGMSLCVLGMAEEFRQQGLAVNALWPRTVIFTPGGSLPSPAILASMSRTTPPRSRPSVLAATSSTRCTVKCVIWLGVAVGCRFATPESITVGASCSAEGARVPAVCRTAPEPPGVTGVVMRSATVATLGRGVFTTTE